MVTPAKRAANDKWDKDNMTHLACKVRKDYAEQIKALAAENGTTVNAIIKTALGNYIKENKKASE